MQYDIYYKYSILNLVIVDMLNQIQNYFIFLNYLNGSIKIVYKNHKRIIAYRINYDCIFISISLIHLIIEK